MSSSISDTGGPGAVVAEATTVEPAPRPLASAPDQADPTTSRSPAPAHGEVWHRLAAISVRTGDAAATLSQVATIVLEEWPALAGLRLDHAQDGAQHRMQIGQPLDDDVTTISPAGAAPVLLAVGPHEVARRWAGLKVRDGGSVTAMMAISVPGPDSGLTLTAWSTGVFDAAGALDQFLTYTWAASALLANVEVVRAANRERDEFHQALASRPTIEQAKGMIMMAHGCSAEVAFEHLVHLSSIRNTKLREVAAALVADVVSRARRERQSSST